MVYTVRKLAKLSGVSVRTLHHYDEIDLLKPAYYGANGYRHYEEKQVLLLQQILFFRNLGFELKRIREIMRKKDFDQLSALHSHRKTLLQELDKTRELIQTIDKTIKHLTGKKKMKDPEFFKGLYSPQQRAYEQEMIESGHYTAAEIEHGHKKLEQWSQTDWQRAQTRWEQLIQDYVQALQDKHTPHSPMSHDLVRRHLQHLKAFGIEVKREELVEKAHFFLGHPDWKKALDERHPQLCDFMLAAMQSYATMGPS